MATNKDILIKELATHPNALKKFSLCLDRQFKHISYWSHFAYILKVDSDVIRQCELQCPESSPTIKLFEFLQATKPELLIKDLLSALDAKQRIDIYRMIKEKGFKDEDKVSEVITCCSSDILDKIALELDSARKPVPNWKSLAKGLKVPYEVYQKFEMFSDYNPTVGLLQYLFTTRDEPILLKDLMDCFIGMGRKDVVHEIENNVQSNDINILANDVLKVGSALLQKIADLLNKDIPGVEGWQGLARHFCVDSSVIERLEGSQDMEDRSPTTRIINFMGANKPCTTIGDIIKALVKIKRYDAIKILRSYFKTDLSYDEEVEDLSVITNDSTYNSVDRIATTPPGTPKMTASLPGTPKMTASLPGTPKMTASLPGTPKMTKFGIQATEQTKTRIFQDDVYKFGLPSKSRHHIIAREKEKEELITILKDNQYQMIVLKATPGCGKTTLVVDTAHDITEGPNPYTVVYVDSINVFSLKDLAYKILSTCGISSFQSCPVSQVIDLFSHSHKNCVLILENLDHMYHSIDEMNQTYTSQTGSNAEDDFPWKTTSKKEEFQRFLKKIVSSAQELKVLVTTWEPVESFRIKIKQMTLSLLNDEQSLELLKSRSDVRIENQPVMDIIKCCGGIPLLLCAAVVFLSNPDGVEAACKTFASSPPDEQLKLLCPDFLPKEERLNHCLGICFERMNLCSRKVLVLLSVFPSTFTLKEAEHISRGSKIDDVQLEQGFQSLAEFGFLNTYNAITETRLLHPAIRSFGILKATKEDDLRVVFEAARRKYIFYTLDILSEIEEEFFSTQSRSAIQKYRSQDENIREIARWCITDSNMDIKVKQFCIQSFISSQYVLLKLMRSHPLKLILCKFAQFCQKNEYTEQFCECLILGGAKIIIGCLCTPYICPTALKEADWCFCKAVKILVPVNQPSFKIEEIKNSKFLQSNKAKAQFLIKYGKCLVRHGYKAQGFDSIKKGIEVRRTYYQDSRNRKNLVMLAIGFEDLAGAYTYVRQYTTAISVREKDVLPIFSKELGMHPFTATAYSQLARNYLELGEYDKAIQANDIALRYREVLLGDHQETARSLFDKGVILAERAQSVLSSTLADAEQSSALREEALLHLQKALAMQERVLDTPEETAKTHQELAVVLYQLGRNEESEQQMNKIAKCVKKMRKIHDDLPCLPKSASPSVEAIAVESAIKREDATSNQTNDSEACSSTREEVKKSWFAGVKEYFKQKLGLNSGETGASTQDGNNIDGYFEKYENFALDYQHQMFLSDLENMIRLGKYSVGAIIAVNVSNVETCAGTCFRIGTRYVITNKHVIDEINKYGISLRNCCVDFNYQEQGPADLRFGFAPSPVLVASKELDYAILELHPDDKREFPPSALGSGFNVAPAGRKLKSEDCLTLIGHPAGIKKQIDVSCPIKDQDDLRQHLEHAQSKRSETDNQTDYDSYLFYIEKASSHPHFATYDVSTFFHGSSGSPGFFLEEKLLVVLHTGYIPFKGTAKKNHVLEYGILMSSVVEDVKRKVPLSDILNDSNTFTSSPESMDIDQVPGL